MLDTKYIASSLAFTLRGFSLKFIRLIQGHAKLMANTSSLLQVKTWSEVDMCGELCNTLNPETYLLRFTQ